MRDAPNGPDLLKLKISVLPAVHINRAKCNMTWFLYALYNVYCHTVSVRVNVSTMRKAVWQLAV